MAVAYFWYVLCAHGERMALTISMSKQNMHRSLSHMQKLLLSFQRQTLYWPLFFRVFTTLSLSVSLTLPLFICDSAGNTESLEAL